MLNNTSSTSLVLLIFFSENQREEDQLLLIPNRKYKLIIKYCGYWSHTHTCIPLHSEEHTMYICIFYAIVTGYYCCHLSTCNHPQQQQQRRVPAPKWLCILLWNASVQVQVKQLVVVEQPGRQAAKKAETKSKWSLSVVYLLKRPKAIVQSSCYYCVFGLPLL